MDNLKTELIQMRTIKLSGKRMQTNSEVVKEICKLKGRTQEIYVYDLFRSAEALEHYILLKSDRTSRIIPVTCWQTEVREHHRSTEIKTSKYISLGQLLEVEGYERPDHCMVILRFYAKTLKLNI